MVWTWAYCCVFDTWFTTNDLLKWLQCSLEKYGPIFFLDWSRQHPCAFKDFTFALDTQALLPPFLFFMLDAFWIPSTVVDISCLYSCFSPSFVALALCLYGDKRSEIKLGGSWLISQECSPGFYDFHGLLLATTIYTDTTSTQAPTLAGRNSVNERGR